MKMGKYYAEKTKTYAVALCGKDKFPFIEPFEQKLYKGETGFIHCSIRPTGEDLKCYLYMVAKNKTTGAELAKIDTEGWASKDTPLEDKKTFIMPDSDVTVEFKAGYYG
jgi:hypothetical protein